MVEMKREMLRLFRNVKPSDIAASTFIFFYFVNCSLNQLYTEKIMDLFLPTVITVVHEVYSGCEVKGCKVNESYKMF